MFTKVAATFSVIFILAGFYTIFIKSKNPDEHLTNLNHNICVDKNLAIISFREGCESATALGFGSGNWDFKKKWCDCVEEKYQVQTLVGSDCSAPKLNAYIEIWNDNSVKVACGTPKEPR